VIKGRFFDWNVLIVMLLFLLVPYFVSMISFASEVNYFKKFLKNIVKANIPS